MDKKPRIDFKQEEMDKIVDRVLAYRPKQDKEKNNPKESKQVEKQAPVS